VVSKSNTNANRKVLKALSRRIRRVANSSRIREEIAVDYAAKPNVLKDLLMALAVHR
jgi:hypothetical protein